ncbi:MAG: tetratricopeptide repeat protein [Deltaproteobacteria bacterium]|nr:tetratricopeptide repeat protein [Deltaproteobacteria bacterium]
MNRKTRRKAQQKRTALWIFVLLFLGVIFAGYRFYQCLYSISPQFHFLTVVKDGERVRLLNGETIQLHYQNTVRISEISTNICFNHGVRLSADDIDAPALLFEEIRISEFIPEKDKLSRFSFRIDIKRFNREMGYVDFVVEPYVEDWLDKADRSIKSEKKVEILEEARKLFSDDRRIKDRLIQEYTYLKRWEKAILLLEEKARTWPDREVFDLLLKAYSATNRKEDCISLMKEILKISPEDFEIRLRLAKQLEDMGRLKESVDHYEKILEIMPDGEKLNLYKNLGFQYSEIGDTERAISYYLKAVEKDKEDADLYYNLSFLYEKTGQRDKSDFFLDKAIGLKSDDIESRLKLAESNIEKKKLEEAEEHLKEVLKLKPDSLQALILMLKIAELREDKNALKTYYRKIISLEPDNKTVINNLGVLEYDTGDYDNALPYFEKLATLDPGDKNVRFFLFDLYRRLQKDRQAFEEAEILISLGSKDLALYHYMFEYLSGREDYKAITEIMKDAVTSHPKENSLRKYLVLAYLKLGKEEEAIEQIREILKLNPGEIQLLSQLGKLLEKSGRFEEAAGVYLKIMNLSPGDKEAKDSYIKVLFRQASLQEKEGKYKAALESYKKVIHIFPGNEQAQEEYLRLRFMVLPGEKE